MLRYARTIARLLEFGVISSCAAIEFCLHGFWLRGAERYRCQAQWLHRYAKGVSWILGLRTERQGDPTPGSLIVSNHLSYVDVFAIASQAPVIFLAKSEVLDWPWGGLLARMAGTVFIKRGQRSDLARVSREIESVINAGVSVVLFLEGTTTDGYQDVLPFHPGLLQPAIEHHWKVTPCAVQYRVTETGGPRGVSWHGDMTFLPHLLEYTQYSATSCLIQFGAPMQADDRKELSARLHAEISQKFADLGKQLGLSKP